MGGGDKKPSIDSSVRDFDVVLVGGSNVAALTKFLQTDDLPWNMALVTSEGQWVLPTSYFACTHGHRGGLEVMSGSVAG